MDGFCWLEGPELCGELNFDLPVIEILAMALVSALVTWVTISLTLSHARRQSDRAIDDARRLALRSAVKDLADASQEAFEAQDLDFVKRLRWQSGYFNLATSRVDYAAEAARWALSYCYISIALNRRPDIESPSGHFFPASGPSMSVLRDIGLWLSNPSVYGPQFEELADGLEAWVDGGGFTPQGTVE